MNPRLRILRDAVVHNTRILLERSGVSRMVAVVKDDAYGVGVPWWLRVLPVEQVAWYAVATPDEISPLRTLGVPPDRILLLYPFYDHGLFREIGKEGVHVALGSREMFDLVTADPEVIPPERIHVSLDLDMVRTGFGWEEWSECVSRWPWDRPPRAWMGHFAHTPEDGSPFEETVRKAHVYHERLRSFWHQEVPAHLANTAVALGGISLPQRWIRPGIGLFGVHPVRKEPDPLRFALRLEAPLVQVHDVPAGTGVSYGHRFVTSRPGRIGVLRIGYGDGLPRALSGKGWAIFRGFQAPLVGAITMDLTLVDLTHLPFVPNPGEWALLLGEHPAMDLWTWAEAAGTIPYEALTHLSVRIQREIVEADQPTTSQRIPPATSPAPRSSSKMPR